MTRKKMFLFHVKPIKRVALIEYLVGVIDRCVNHKERRRNVLDKRDDRNENGV